MRLSLILPRRKQPRVLRRREGTASHGSGSAYHHERRADTLQAAKLDAKLWGGFSRSALLDLEELKNSVREKPAERVAAAWYLSRWFLFQKNYARALENAVLMREIDARRRCDKRQFLLEADCLTWLGLGEGARKILDAIPGAVNDPDYCLAYANTYVSNSALVCRETDSARLHWINRVYEMVGLLPLLAADPGRPLALDNLTTRRPCAADEQPRVSVIVPAFKAQLTLPIALNALLEQTWTNLQIIVVDDGSPDDTYAVAQSFARRDDRVIAIRLPENQGAYTARNAGLERATGDFITTHDADDWSHPQKIEIQVSALLKEPSSVLSYTDWARARSNLRFTGLTRPFNFISANISSTLFRRDVFARYGGWDNVRVSGDTEYILRMREERSRMNRVMEGTPLCFGLDDNLSLTRQSATHVSTRYHGIRREYLESAQHWHHCNNPRSITAVSDRRPFPAPASILSTRKGPLRSDLLFVADLSSTGATFASTVDYVEAALKTGRSVAVFNWPQYNLDVTQPLQAEIRRLSQNGELQVVAPGEKIKVSTVMVTTPVSLQHVIDLYPKVELDSLLVIVNQTAARLRDGSGIQYDPKRVRENLKEVFGSEGVWIPLSDLMRQFMADDPRYPVPYAENWMTLIDIDTWCAEPLCWRGRKRQRPTVGRHGRDHYTEWPSTSEAVRAAYCADKECDVVILGGASAALNVIEKMPSNWTLYDGHDGVRNFISNLDFFIHHPHENCVDQDARFIIEAMAVGRPVLLSPAFKSIFGVAAVYVDPPNVWPTISRLWNDEQTYLARAEAGRQFVWRNSDPKLFEERLRRLAQGSHPATVSISG